jgi:AcrR family transcriptional regulator
MQHGQPAASARRRSPRRREDLVDAAVRVFATTGVAGTSVDEIVRAAGVAKGTFYLYFETRDDIVTAVAERLVEGVGRQMDHALAAGGPTRTSWSWSRRSTTPETLPSTTGSPGGSSSGSCRR